MTKPLEPLPTKQLVSIKNEPRQVDVHVENQPLGNDRGNVYPWLLAASTCLSMALCWLYVTKPVIASSSTEPVMLSDQPIVAVSAVSSPPGEEEITQVTVVSEESGELTQLLPSDDGLPGSRVSHSEEKVEQRVGEYQIDDLQLKGWEKTNLKVQHILHADSGNGEIEKIVMDVPVFYQSRSMRWTPGDIAAARSVLTKLMVYEANLSKLKSEGESILNEWNAILSKSVPDDALRADSPSLPYNHSSLEESEEHSDSKTLIKVEN